MLGDPPMNRRGRGSQQVQLEPTQCDIHLDPLCPSENCYGVLGTEYLRAFPPAHNYLYKVGKKKKEKEKLREMKEGKGGGHKREGFGFLGGIEESMVVPVKGRGWHRNQWERKEQETTSEESCFLATGKHRVLGQIDGLEGRDEREGLQIQGVVERSPLCIPRPSESDRFGHPSLTTVLEGVSYGDLVYPARNH